MRSLCSHNFAKSLQCKFVVIFMWLLAKLFTAIFVAKTKEQYALQQSEQQKKSDTLFTHTRSAYKFTALRSHLLSEQHQMKCLEN